MEEPKENTPLKINGRIVEIMKLSRHERRRIAKMNGLKNIPSIKNVEIRKLTPEENEHNLQQAKTQEKI
jgi:hypothetical protein